MDQSSKNVKEADKSFKKGKEAITTGVFRWNKDYNLAASYFEEAAKLYKLSKMWEKEIASLKYAIECNTNLHDDWAVARNYEGIISSWIDNNPNLNIKELVDLTRNVRFTFQRLIIQSGIYFKAADSGQNTLKLYVRVAKLRYLLQKQEIEQAENLILEALTESEEQQAFSTRSDILNQYVDILIETKRFSQVAKLYHDELNRCKEEPQRYPIGQVQFALIIVIMHILQDEIVRANSELEQLIINAPNFHKSSEFRACDQVN